MKIWWTWSGSNRRPLPCHAVYEKASCRRQGTYGPAQPAKTAQLALFAAKMLPNLPSGPYRADCVDQPKLFCQYGNLRLQREACEIRKHVLTYFQQHARQRMTIKSRRNHAYTDNRSAFRAREHGRAQTECGFLGTARSCALLCGLSV